MAAHSDSWISGDSLSQAHRYGVVLRAGSRRGEVEQKIRAALEGVQAGVRELADKGLHTPGEPTLRLITCLAGEGDRLAARIAQASLGYAAHFCLPSRRGAHDPGDVGVAAAAAAGRAAHDAPERTAAVFELAVDGGAQHAYDQAVRIMLGHSDLLVALEDGEPDPPHGGRVDAVLRARKAGIPVIALSVLPGRAPRIIHGGASAAFTEPGLAEKIKEILGFYAGRENHPGRGALVQYLAERRRTRNCAVLFQLLYRALAPGGGIKHPGLRIGLEDDEAAEEAWRGKLKRHFGWADSLAVIYADIYRSMIVLRHTLVLMTTLGLAAGFYWGFWRAGAAGLSYVRIAGFSLQLLGVSGIIGLSVCSRKREWQRRFMDYRILAEMLRLLRHLHPLGIVFIGIHAPVDHKHSFSWVNYQFRAVLRSLGAPALSLNTESMRGLLQRFLSGVEGQIQFHRKNEARCAGAVRKLNNAWRVLFGAGLCMIAIRIAAHYYYTDESLAEKWLKTYCNMLALILPALGGYAYALLTSLGFERLRDRSREMAQALERQRTEIRMLLARIEQGDASVGYEDVRLLAQVGVKADMLEELTDWRIFVNSKSITVL